MHYYPGTSSCKDDPDAWNGYWRRRRPPGRDSARLLFWLMVFGLGCVSLLGSTWLGSMVLARKTPEKPLQVGVLLPKLNSSYTGRKDEPFRISEPEPSELAHLKERKTPTAHNPLTLPAVVEQPELPALPHMTAEPPQGLGLVELAKVELPSPPLFETCDEPVVYLHPCTPQRGDTPMIRNWKTLTLYSLLSAASVVYVSEPTALAGGEKKDPVRVEGLEELRKAVTDLTGRIDTLEKKNTKDQRDIIELLSRIESVALADLTRKMQGIQDDVGGLKKNLEAIQLEQLKQKILADDQKEKIKNLTADIRELEKRQFAGGTPIAPVIDKSELRELKKDVGSLAERMSSLQDALAKLSAPEMRTSKAAPQNSTVTASGVGKVMLINGYSSDLLFEINGRPYRVRPQSSRLIENVPLGPLTWEVSADYFGVVRRGTATLTGGEPFQVMAFNQR